MTKCKNCGVEVWWNPDSTKYTGNTVHPAWERIKKPKPHEYWTLCTERKDDGLATFHEVDPMQLVADYVAENL